MSLTEAALLSWLLLGVPAAPSQRDSSVGAGEKKTRRLAEQTLRRELAVPNRAEFEWSHSFVKGSVVLPWSGKKLSGLVGCGLVKTVKLRPPSAFLVVADRRAIRYHELDNAWGEIYRACRRAGLVRRVAEDPDFPRVNTTVTTPIIKLRSR